MGVNDNGFTVCKLSDYYETIAPAIYNSNLLGIYNDQYLNHTDGLKNVICQRNSQFVNDYCITNFGYPSNYEALTADQKYNYQVSVGCRECSTDSVPFLNKRQDWGLFVFDCRPKSYYENWGNTPD